MPSISLWIKVKILCLLFTPLCLIAVAALLNRLQRYWMRGQRDCRASKETKIGPSRPAKPMPV